MVVPPEKNIEPFEQSDLFPFNLCVRNTELLDHTMKRMDKFGEHIQEMTFKLNESSELQKKMSLDQTDFQEDVQKRLTQLEKHNGMSLRQKATVYGTFLTVLTPIILALLEKI